MRDSKENFNEILGVKWLFTLNKKYSKAISS